MRPLAGRGIEGRRLVSLGSRLRSWARAMTSRTRLEGEMDEELRFHVESYVDDLVARGVARAEAERRARIEFGAVAVHKEEMRASLGLRLWDDLAADLRYALRMLWKSPGFTVIAVGSLALGIGANTAIFTIARQVLMDQLNVPHPEQLVLFHWVSGKDSAAHHLWGDWDNDQGSATSTSFPYPVYQELKKQNRLMGDLFAFKGNGQLTATVDGEPDVVQGEMVSGNYYRELGVHPQLGRAIEPADDAVEGGGNVVTISDGYWTRRFGRSPSVIGKSILLNTKPFTIVGVNPPHFSGAKNVHTSPEVFMPLSIQPVIQPRRNGSILSDPEMWWMQIMARRNAGVKDAKAAAQLDVTFEAAVRSLSKPKQGDSIPRLVLADGSRGLNESARSLTQPTYVLMALGGLVLLLACANVANLLLARSAARQREISVRLALGASRGRVLRQALTESLLLSGIGGLAGLLVGYGAFTAIPKLMSTPWEPFEFSGGFDGSVFAFAACASVVTGLLFGLLPAWKATQTPVNAELKDRAGTVTQRRSGYAGKAIVAFQVALSTLLVVGAVLFVRTLSNLGSVNLGFRSDHLLLFQIRLPATQYPAGKDILLHRALEEKIAQIPGVQAMTLSNVALISNDQSYDDFHMLDGAGNGAGAKEGDQGGFDNVVGQAFFSTMGIPMVAGRDFNSGDTETSLKVGIINERLAREFYAGTSPIGKRFRSSNLEYQIVGISKDAHYDSVRKDPPGQFFLPYRQTADFGSDMNYEIRTRMDAASLVPQLRRAVQSVDKNLPLIDVRTQEQQIAGSIQQERVFASLTAGFGGLALALASIGIYGVMAYTVSRRTNEIGVRLALGARTGQILGMVLGESTRLTLVGVVAGLGVALLVTRFLKSMLYGLKPHDPFTLVSAAVLLLGVALLAAWAPAWRASRVEPMVALRHE